VWWILAIAGGLHVAVQDADADLRVAQAAYRQLYASAVDTGSATYSGFHRFDHQCERAPDRAEAWLDLSAGPVVWEPTEGVLWAEVVDLRGERHRWDAHKSAVFVPELRDDLGQEQLVVETTYARLVIYTEPKDHQTLDRLAIRPLGSSWDFPSITFPEPGVSTDHRLQVLNFLLFVNVASPDAAYSRKLRAAGVGTSRELNVEHLNHRQISAILRGLELASLP